MIVLNALKLTRFVVLCGLTLGMTLGAASVQAAPSGDKPVPASKPAAPVTVEGFRSARFGMTEAEVRKAMAKDLGLKDEDIQRDVDKVERRVMLVGRKKDLLPDSGEAQVIYFFGYRSKKLNQILIRWGGVVDKDTTPDQISSAATALGNYFVSQGFPEEGRIVNKPVAENRIAVFRGQDPKGHVVLLQVYPEIDREATQKKIEAAQKEGKKAEDVEPVTRLAMQLAYFQDPKNLDVFQLEKGSF